MHASSLENMQKCYESYICGDYYQKKEKLIVLDIGGANVNGSYADIFSTNKFNYIAADITAGEGVDLVLDDPYKLPFDDNSIDIIISGQAFEHVEYFWLLFEEMARISKDDGWIFLIAPSSGPIHQYPVDCYRFYPDAYRALAKYSKLNAVDVFLDERGPWRDLVGVFSKNSKTTKSQVAPWEPLKANEINKYSANTSPVSTEFSAQTHIDVIQGSSSYLDILKILHKKIQPSNYLEIGVRKGNSLSLSKCSTIAIDPEPEIGLKDFDQVELYKMPSDHFFSHQTVIDFREKPIDFAFIDGMHLFEFVLRDFMNVEARSSSHTVVVIDDIFPNHEQQALRTRSSRVWTGDVWKIIICLKEYRPDLTLSMIDSSPTGLLIINGLKKENKVLMNQYNPIIRKFSALNLRDYNHLILERAEAISPLDKQFESSLNNMMKTSK